MMAGEGTVELKRCPSCQRRAASDAIYCVICGTPLAGPKVSRRPKPVSGTTVLFRLTVVILCAVGGTILLSLLFLAGSSLTTNSRPALYRVAMDAYCGISEVDAQLAYNSIANKDFAAIVGLIERKRIFAVVPGDRLYAANGSTRLVSGRIAAGTHMGERCFIPSNMIQAE